MNDRITQKELDSRIDKVKKCGENRGPHDYIPMSWTLSETSKHVTQMLCRVCFNQVSIKTIVDNFPEAKIL